MKQKLAIAYCLATAALPSIAQTDIKTTTTNNAYIQDGRGTITRSGTGLCWRSGYWTPADSLPGCDGTTAVLAKQPAIAAIAVITPITKAIAAPAVKSAAPKRCDFAVTLQNDETFDFNKTALKPLAKQRIDSEILTKLANCAQLDLVIVTGHTDLIGTQQYNQKLSEKRATAVASYLSSKGITAMIDNMGMGKTQQIKTCDEKLSQTKLAECLGPNRRVVIEGRGLAK